MAATPGLQDAEFCRMLVGALGADHQRAMAATCRVAMTMAMAMTVIQTLGNPLLTAQSFERDSNFTGQSQIAMNIMLYYASSTINH